MMNGATEQKLQTVFRAVFDIPDGRDVQSLRQVNFSSWDSLAHVSLVAALENEFKITLNISEALQVTSFEAARLLLEEKGV